MFRRRIIQRVSYSSKVITIIIMLKKQIRAFDARITEGNSLKLPIFYQIIAYYRALWRTMGSSGSSSGVSEHLFPVH